jgi:hypothetical protein
MRKAVKSPLPVKTAAVVAIPNVEPPSSAASLPPRLPEPLVMADYDGNSSDMSDAPTIPDPSLQVRKLRARKTATDPRDAKKIARKVQRAKTTFSVTRASVVKNKDEVESADGSPLAPKPKTLRVRKPQTVAGTSEVQRAGHEPIYPNDTQSSSVVKYKSTRKRKVISPSAEDVDSDVYEEDTEPRSKRRKPASSTAHEIPDVEHKETTFKGKFHLHPAVSKSSLSLCLYYCSGRLGYVGSILEYFLPVLLISQPSTGLHQYGSTRVKTRLRLHICISNLQNQHHREEWTRFR